MTDNLHCLNCGVTSAVLVRSVVHTEVTYQYGPAELVGRTVPVVIVRFHCPSCHRDGQTMFEMDWSPNGWSGPTQCPCGRRARFGRQRKGPPDLTEIV